MWVYVLVCCAIGLLGVGAGYFIRNLFGSFDAANRMGVLEQMTAYHKATLDRLEERRARYQETALALEAKRAQLLTEISELEDEAKKIHDKIQKGSVEELAEFISKGPEHEQDS